MNEGPRMYTRPQRLVALGYGLTTHALFGGAVFLMAASLYHGLHLGRGLLTGWRAVVGNGLLALQFPLIHSFLLRSRGRTWLKRMAPLNLGGPLATTTFAGIASLQLILCFGLWSPLGPPLWSPPPSVHLLFTGAYAISWILLLRSMHEAGLSLQTGSLGWRAIWQNRRPVFPPLPRQGLHGVIRQPIYVSFTLIVWTAPAFTPEKIGLALLWTGYCVAGSWMKERRMARIYGEPFHAYQQQVPFWLPKRSKPVT